MAKNMEDIEAKLCAYIDGELDPVERAEIEKHLASNPGHARLIGELRHMRTLLHDLPRAVAPPDVAENLQGQLERSVLLGVQSADPIGSSLKFNYRRLWISAAAMIALCLGLGIVIYQMLPSRTRQMAMETPPATASNRSLTAAKAEEPRRDDLAKAAGTQPDAAWGNRAPAPFTFARDTDGVSNKNSVDQSKSVPELSASAAAREAGTSVAAAERVDSDVDLNSALTALREIGLPGVIARAITLKDVPAPPSITLNATLADAREVQKVVSDYCAKNNLSQASIASARQSTLTGSVNGPIGGANPQEDAIPDNAGVGGPVPKAIVVRAATRTQARELARILDGFDAQDDVLGMRRNAAKDKGVAPGDGRRLDAELKTESPQTTQPVAERDRKRVGSDIRSSSPSIAQPDTPAPTTRPVDRVAAASAPSSHIEERQSAAPSDDSARVNVYILLPASEAAGPMRAASQNSINAGQAGNIRDKTDSSAPRK